MPITLGTIHTMQLRMEPWQTQTYYPKVNREPRVGAETWSYPNVDGMDPAETVVAQSLRLMARIKLNR